MITTLDLGKTGREALAWKKIKEAEEKLDWDGISDEIDNVVYDPTLSNENAIAQTRVDGNYTELAFGKSFFQKDYSSPLSKDISQFEDGVQLATTIHELIHVSDYNGRLDKDLKSWGADKKLIREVVGNPYKESKKELEGKTELLTSQLMENISPNSYRPLGDYGRWKRQKQRELIKKGVNIDLQLGSDSSKNIGNYAGEIDTNLNPISYGGRVETFNSEPSYDVEETFDTLDYKGMFSTNNVLKQFEKVGDYFRSLDNYVQEVLPGYRDPAY